MLQIEPSVLALAGVGLPDAWQVPRGGWSGRLDVVFDHGLAGLLARALNDGLIELDASGTRRLRNRLESEAARAVQLEGELIRLADVLARLQVAVLEGPVLAHGAYSDPSERPFTELDLLVGEQHFETAQRELATYGYARNPAGHPSGSNRTEHETARVVHPGGVAINLHRTLATGAAGSSIAVDAVLANRQAVPVGSSAVLAPSWEAHLIEVSLHAVIGDGLTRAQSIRDTAQVALHPALDAEQAIALARQSKVDRFVGEGLRAAIEGFGVKLPGALTALAEQPTADDVPNPTKVGSVRSRSEARRQATLRQRFARLLGWPSGRRPRRDSPREDEEPGTAWAPPDPDPLRPAPATTAPSAEPESPAPGVTDSAAQYRAGELVRLDRRTEAGTPSLVALGSQSPYPAARLERPDRGVLSRRSGRDASEVDTTEPPALTRQERWTRARPERVVNADDGPAVRPALPPQNESSERAAQEPATTSVEGDAPSGGGLLFAALALLAFTIVFSLLGTVYTGLVLMPITAMLFAGALARHIARRRPEEAWVGRWLLLGVLAKLVVSYIRYLSLVVGYDSFGDATGYDHVGRQFRERMARSRRGAPTRQPP